jgi:RNase H-fold protein (predicted Holliday junction resolvase)
MTDKIKNPLDRKNVMLDGEMYDYFDQDNNIQSGGGVMPTEPLQPKPPKSKINLAQVGTAMQIGSAIGDLGGSIISGVVQKKDNENARNEARELANITREDTLKQQNIELSFRKKQIEQEEQQMQLQQMRETINQRFSIWRNKFQRELQNINKARQAAVEFKQKYMQLDEEKRQQIVRGMI